MADILENAEAELTPQMRNLIDMLWSEWKTVEQQIEELTTWSGSPPQMRVATAFVRSQALDRSWPRPSLPPSATELPSVRGETSQHGSASCHGSIRPVVRRSCLASVNGATRLCAGYRFTARERQYCISSATEHRLERGSMHSMRERTRTSSQSPCPTSWPASFGEAKHRFDAAAFGAQLVHCLRRRFDESERNGGLERRSMVLQGLDRTSE
jgi:hypothetical protein